MSLNLAKQIDLSSNTFAVCINQQGDRLQAYRNSSEEDSYEPARFNILLLHHPSGNGPATVVQIEQASWFQTSLVVKSSKAMPSMPQGNYSLLVIAMWNKSAFEYPDFQSVRVSVHAPCATNLRSQPPAQGMTTLHKIFIMDALKRIKLGEASTFEGEFAGSGFRVVQPAPFDNLVCGYIYT